MEERIKNISNKTKEEDIEEIEEVKEVEEAPNRFNSISKPTNTILNIMFLIIAAVCIVPFLFVLMVSFTSEASLQVNGYRFWPEEWSLEAYKYIFKSGSNIIRAYGITIIVTITGTILGLIIMTTFAYALSRKNFAYRKFFTKLIFIPMLFSGGMVSSYLVVTKFLGLKNNILALILPICVSSFHIIILRTFFKTSVPDAIVESAKIDGASEFVLFMKVVLPISLPGIATIALFLTLGFWNDWFNAMLYIDNNSLIPVQYLLIKLETSMEFLINNSNTMGVSATEAVAKMPKETVKMAIVVITTIPIIFAYPFFQKYFVSGLTIGAVKE